MMFIKNCNYFALNWLEIPNSKIVHRRKITTTDVRGNKRFFILKVLSDFDFDHFLGN